MAAKRSKGGLGFKDLQLFNKALLAKQVWKLITQPNLLVSKVLKEKYYPKLSVFNSKVPQNASWIWRSLSGGCQLKLVSELIRNNRWNRALIFKTFNHQDAARILTIPISVTRIEGSYYWAHNQNGQYTVQSGYKAWVKKKEMEISGRRDEAGTSLDGTISQIWRSLWEQNVSQKMKIFIWKCLHRGLPVREVIYSRTRQGTPICAGCGANEETIEHMLLQCHKVKEIWEMAPVKWDGIEHLSNCFTKWWSAIHEAQIWKARNNREFNHKEKEPFKIIEKALKEWTEFEEANKWKDAGNSTLETEEQQRADQEQMECHTGLLLKIHTHQSKDQPTVGIGISATDYMGQLQAVWALTERTS
nr:uncharacterized protein LOC113689326 [Coffea arabica]